MTVFWLTLWSTILAVGWLLPNHYRPWVSFHLDAWIATVLMLASAAVIVRTHTPLVLHRIALLVAILACIPWIQYSFGLIHLHGVAWISSIYLFGFFFAMLVGTHWETSTPGQLCDGLFLAIGMASLISVGLQLQQWLQIDGIELWKMGGGPERPHANFGQPNLLGTFLLWGLLAVAWGWIRRCIGGPIAMFTLAFLLFGLALTASRTGWIGLTILVVGIWVWRDLWQDSRVPFVVTGLGAYFVLCVAGQTWLRSALLSDVVFLPDYLSSISGHHRLLAWAAFIDAIAQRPWFGYGWYQVVPAQLAVAIEHPSLYGVFTSSHNLLLDLFLWIGIPFGFLVFFYFLRWILRIIRAVQLSEDAILVLFLGVVVNHSMLELPMHFAYILLPVGLVIGILNTRFGETPLFYLPRWSIVSIWVGAALVLGLTVRDYFRIETSYENFRMEQMRIKVARLDLPDVVLLTQWRDFLEVVRIDPRSGMSQPELDRLRDVANFFAGPLLIHKLASGLALNDQAAEAKLWLMRLCKSSPVEDCAAAKSVWAKQARKHPEIAAIPWPVKTAD